MNKKCAVGRGCVLLLAMLACSGHSAAAEVKQPHWIGVIAPGFRETIKPLADHRRQEGMRVTIIETSAALIPEQIKGSDAELLRERVGKLCRESAGPCYVLLVGAPLAGGAQDPTKFVVPALQGTVGRMKGQLSDNSYGCLGKKMMPDVAVGRLPARTPDELARMIQKMLVFERDTSPELWRNRLTVLVGNPGGSTPAEQKLSDLAVGSMISAQLGQIDPSWSLQVLVHAPASDLCVPDDRLRTMSLDYLKQGQVFSMYLGHSVATGFWSGGPPFLSREDWAELRIPRGTGVFVTGGCFSCQLQGTNGEGYGLAAIRNPDGPVAVMGASGESYAIAGKLAAEGMVTCLSKPQPPARLGDYWLALKQSIASEPVDILTFWLFDQADGTHGQVSLDEQRREHLEMWMLLGDPAIKLPTRPASLRLTAVKDAVPGQAITISGTLPAALSAARVHLTLERLAGSKAPDIEPLPSDAGKAREVMLANHRRANQVVLLEQDIQPRGVQFAGTLMLPEKLPWPQLIVRAYAATSQDSALGILRLTIVTPPAKKPPFAKPVQGGKAK